MPDERAGMAPDPTTLDGLDVAELEPLYAFRLALECVAARYAAAARSDLRGRVDVWRRDVLEALRRDEREHAVEADWCFHLAVAEASGNRFVIDALASRRGEITASMRVYLSRSHGVDSLWDEHAEIAAALASGDADLAETLLGAHIQESENVVRSVVRSTSRETPIPREF